MPNSVMPGSGTGTMPDRPSWEGIAPVLCVDLDGTLICTDSLLESVLTIVRRNPLNVFILLLWMTRGIAGFKYHVSAAAPIDPVELPYNQQLLSYLREQHGRGRTLVLATASAATTADRVATHLGIFSEVHSSDRQVNLKGHAKAERLVQAYGRAQFSYVGDSAVDRVVWRAARSGILVNTTPSFRNRIATDVAIEREFPRQYPIVGELLRELRPHQWTKNLLLAVPLLTAHRYMDIRALAELAVAFVVMCMVASAIYIANDLLDLAADRKHPTKRTRPLASGRVSIRLGMGAFAALAAVASCLALTLPSAFRMALGGYVVAALAYSFWFKHLPWLDVIFLAGLYTLRIYIGALAIAVPVSSWLFAYSSLVFLSLALLKRDTELRSLADEDRSEWARAYHISQRLHVEYGGIGAAILSGFVLIGYVESTAVVSLYEHPAYLWGLCPLLTYLLMKAWAVARAGKMHHDPVMYALTRWDTYVALLATLGLILVARG